MHEGEWIKTLSYPVLVVGNGVLSGPVPEEQYGSVIRINNYVLGGRSGNKVTHWVANGYQDIEHRPVAPVLIPWSAKIQERRGFPGVRFFRENRHYLYTRDDAHIRAWFPGAAVRGKRFPSTGFCLLALLLMHRVGPDLVGFDGMKTGHEGNPNWKHGHVQSVVLREWAIIQGWRLKQR